MYKLKVEEKNKFNYKLSLMGEIFFLNLEFIDTVEPEVGDYICLDYKILDSKNFYAYGKVLSKVVEKEDQAQIIKDGVTYDLERYYG